MKNFLTTLFFCLLLVNVFAAKIEVKSFRLLANDSTARVIAPLADFNGDVSAIIKVVTSQTGLNFDCGSIGIVKTINKPSEIWVYVPYDAKRMTITHSKLGMLDDYFFPVKIEKAKVYEMVIISGKISTTVQELEKQYLVINAEPTDASIYINDSLVGKGTYQAKLKPGQYSYRVDAQLYHPENGKISIINTKVNLPVKLQPAFGNCIINTVPEIGAKVTIDGVEQLKSTPCQSESLASGHHRIEIEKDMYQKLSQDFEIVENKTTNLLLSLQPNFAEITINSQSNAKIFIDNVFVGEANYKGRLKSGKHFIETRQVNHSTTNKYIEVVAGGVISSELYPTPIYGVLNINTKPDGAQIYINGEKRGITPSIFEKMLVGDYSLELTKPGYNAILKQITIREGETSFITESYSQSKKVEFTSTPSYMNICIDGSFIGKTPFNNNLSFGKHSIEISDGQKTSNQTIAINDESASVFHFDLYDCQSRKSITSYPSGAKIIVNGEEVGVSPMNYTLLTKSAVVKIKQNGYQTYTERIQCDIDNDDIVATLTPEEPFVFRESVSIGGCIGLNSFSLIGLGVGANVKFTDWGFLKSEYSVISGFKEIICLGELVKKSTFLFQVGIYHNGLIGSGLVYGIGYGNFRKHIDFRIISSSQIQLNYRFGF